ncbi:MAG TPA: HNH endonuclease signature motif containing protein [Bacilli bacterium]|nr:HNH endonuclease signature motif containing protein [Bacilli bacterium]
MGDRVSLTRREVREREREESRRQDFSALVRAHVRERDQERCVLCGKPGREVHHIIPRAQGGLGTADNGVCLDARCHHEAHRSKQVAKRLLRYRERVLLPVYGLSSPSHYVWLDPLDGDRCRCGGTVVDGSCSELCGLVLPTDARTDA